MTDHNEVGNDPDIVQMFERTRRKQKTYHPPAEQQCCVALVLQTRHFIEKSVAA